MATGFAADEETETKTDADLTTDTTDDHRSDPERLIDHTVERVLSILKMYNDTDDEPSRQQMRRGIHEAMLAATDMELVSKRALGNYRRKFSESQFDAFVEKFTHLLFSTYLDNLEAYNNETVEITSMRKLRPTVANVKTRVVSEDKEIPIDYSLLKKDELWYVYDLKVEGVSLMSNYRSQFADLLKNNSPDELLKKIDEKIQQKQKKND